MNVLKALALERHAVGRAHIDAMITLAGCRATFKRSDEAKGCKLIAMVASSILACGENGERTSAVKGEQNPRVVFTSIKVNPKVGAKRRAEQIRRMLAQ